MPIDFKYDSKTDLYCIFGNPVTHSKSPIMHNALFNDNKINAVYLAFNINDIKTGINAIRELDIKGVSITIPFKEKVIEFLDDIDPEAKEIGAVNTIVNRNGKLTGFNTDWSGGVKPVKELGIIGKTVGIIGAGGAARALAYGIKKNGGKLTIINRSQKNGEHLSSLFNCNFINFNKIETNSFDIIINTTPLGMTPDIKNTPFKKEYLKKNMIVMDIVYNPLETQLIKDAKNAGCKTIDGLSMFINQGVKQFELWTGIKSTKKFMSESLKKTLINELN
ncbi:MAG: shikimate dehydrogenase [Desulfobacterales bacterium]|nr:shikimate dehydrogenase [Desulfobacterales bacterium]